MILKDKKILVTGGAGFIGSHFVEAIAPANTVTIYDNFFSSVISPDYFKNKRVNVIRADILHEKKLASAMKGIDVVFHFAVACVRLSLKNERFVHDVNATGTLSTLLAAKRAGVKRFIYTDIERDGMLTSPNFEAFEKLRKAIKGQLIASGGVSKIDHIKKLQELGADGVIIGKALYEGHIDLKEAIRVS